MFGKRAGEFSSPIPLFHDNISHGGRFLRSKKILRELFQIINVSSKVPLRRKTLFAAVSRLTKEGIAPIILSGAPKNRGKGRATHFCKQHIRAVCVERDEQKHM